MEGGLVDRLMKQTSLSRTFHVCPVALCPVRCLGQPAGLGIVPSARDRILITHTISSHGYTLALASLPFPPPRGSRG